MNNLSSFIADAKKAVDEEKNYLKASRLWQKHLGDRFPDGTDKEEEKIEAKSFAHIVGNSKPYHG